MSFITALASCMERLSPERKEVVQKAYAKARLDAMGDGEASTLVFGLLTESERGEHDASGATMGRDPGAGADR